MVGAQDVRTTRANEWEKPLMSCIEAEALLLAVLS